MPSLEGTQSSSGGIFNIEGYNDKYCEEEDEDGKDDPISFLSTSPPSGGFCSIYFNLFPTRFLAEPKLVRTNSPCPSFPLFIISTQYETNARHGQGMRAGNTDTYAFLFIPRNFPAEDFYKWIPWPTLPS